jgi:hypothetical protein
MDIVDHNNGEMLMQLIKASKISVLRGTIPVRLEKDGVVADHQGIEIKISTDSALFSGRLFSNDDLAKSLGNGSTKVKSIGDCAQPDTVMGAVWGGFNAVREIEL